MCAFRICLVGIELVLIKYTLCFVFQVASLSPTASRSDVDPNVTSPDPMTSSIYGSLDQDLRSDAFESTSDSSFRSMPQSGLSSTTLGSFYSALGGSSTTSPVGSTSIGSESNRPKLSRASMEPPLPPRSPSDPPSPDHKCLLDVMSLELLDMDVYSAEWRRLEDCTFTQRDDLEFPSYVVQREVSSMGLAIGRFVCKTFIGS